MVQGIVSAPVGLMTVEMLYDFAIQIGAAAIAVFIYAYLQATDPRSR